MNSFSFNYKGSIYDLTQEKCMAMYNDEVSPITNIEFNDFMDLLNESEDVSFEMEYFDSCCEQCKSNNHEGSRSFSYLEFHFYLFAKDAGYVLSSISKGYEENSFIQLKNSGIVDEAYMACILVCPKCGDFSVEIDYCDF